MLAELASLRDDGKAFPVRTAAGKTLTLKPFQVCRGYTRLAPPVTPGYQDFHWLMSVHPLDIFRPQITPDEALWMVLWTQGLSEEGGARMKTYHYGKEIVTTLFEIASLATGLNAAAEAAKVAVNQAAQAAAAAATKAAGEAAAKAALEEAARKLAEQAAQDYVRKVGEEVPSRWGARRATCCATPSWRGSACRCPACRGLPPRLSTTPTAGPGTASASSAATPWPAPRCTRSCSTRA